MSAFTGPHPGPIEVDAMPTADEVTLVDVSLRDGLQDQLVFVSTQEKLRLLDLLIAAGLRSIEVTSFVHPGRVPQLADAEELIAELPRPAAARFSALTLNERGYTRALGSFNRAGFSPGTYDLVYVVSASALHNEANNNASIERSLAIFDAMAERARADGVSMRAVVACAFRSPWPEEVIEPHAVAAIAERLARGAVRQITLADTVGLAIPPDIERIVAAVQAARLDVPLGLHLHDNRGVALENAAAGLNAGVRVFEAALAGLGGCPFVPEPQRNVDLIALASLARTHGLDAGVDPVALANVADTIRSAIAASPAIEGLASAHT